MRAPIRIGLALMAAAVVSCVEGAGGAGAEPVVAGRVVDGAGRGIAGAEIVVNNTVWHNHNIVLSSGADGSYRYVMPATDSWYVRGTIVRQYHGRSYTLPLHPSFDGAFAGMEGAVCDLDWRLSGPVPTSFGGAGFYGGTVVVNNYSFDDIDMAAIELTLRPTDALIDGTQGRTIARRVVRNADGYAVEDVPIGSYEISARLADGGPLKLRQRRAADDRDKVTLDFEPSYEGATSYHIDLAVSR